MNTPSAINKNNMSDPLKEQIAQDKYGKSFEDLDSREKQSVGGTKGGMARRDQMAAEHGGDASAGYQEMGHKGGEARTEQMADEHGGDASQGFSEMGSKGGQA